MTAGIPPGRGDHEKMPDLESLRLKAEAAVADAKLTRRPTYAPPMILDGELLDACRQLGWLAPDDPPVACLWARFLDPKKYGIRCVGFALRAGLKHTGKMFYQAKRGARIHDGDFVEFDSAKWNTDTWFWAPPRQIAQLPGKSHSWTMRCVIREAEAGKVFSEDYVEECRQGLAELQVVNDAADAQYRLRLRATKLAAERIAQFTGNSDVEMAAAGRLTGACAICHRELTTALSLERGIGPECWRDIKPETQSAFTDMLVAVRQGQIPQTEENTHA